MTSRYAVLGSPISQSQSPALHHAAISVLAIDAGYTAIDVSESEFPEFLTTEGSAFDGFSLTMPLKRVVRSFLTHECDVSRLTGSVNTIVRTPEGWHGHNTDVFGAQTAIAQSLGTHFSTATVLGAGATAASVVVALSNLGTRNITVLARNLQNAGTLTQLAQNVGVELRVLPLGGQSTQSDLLVNTLPGNAELDETVVDDIDAAALFNVGYSPWPNGLAREWANRGLPTSNGLLMLLWQAVQQARVFYGDGIDVELPREDVVVTAMRSAVGL